MPNFVEILLTEHMFCRQDVGKGEKKANGQAVDLRFCGGGKGARTPGLRLAKPALSQLSYTPTYAGNVPFTNKRAGGDSAHAGASISKWWATEDSNF